MDSFSTAGAFVQQHGGGLGIIVWEVPLIKHFFRDLRRRRQEGSVGKNTGMGQPSLRQTFTLPNRRFHDRESSDK